MRDSEWKAIEAELKREIPFDPSAIRGVMERVREAAEPPWPVRAWHWLVRPRPVAVSPVGGVLGAATFAGLILLLALNLPRGSADGALAAGYTAAGEASEIRNVQFVLVAEDAAQVAMAGDFNDWNPHATPLQRTGQSGVWSVVVPLSPGAYLYAFVIDGNTWVADSTAPRAPENAFGGPSSIVLVGDGI